MSLLPSGTVQRSSQTPAALLAALVASDPGRPRITCYDDTDGPTRGERVELSARVLANWVAKAGNLAREEFDAGPGTIVRLDLPPHWRTLYWALAAWSLGAVIDIPRHRSDSVAGTTGSGATGPDDTGPDDTASLATPSPTTTAASAATDPAGVVSTDDPGPDDAASPAAGNSPTAASPATGNSPTAASPATGNSPTADRPDVVVTDGPWSDIQPPALVVVTLAALARSASAPVPAGAVDEAREIATYGDVLDLWDTPAPGDPALRTGGTVIRYSDLVLAPDPGPAAPRVHTSTRDTAAFLRVAVDTWAAGGSVVLTRGEPPVERLESRLRAEGVTPQP
ncbi:MAG: TIGR03089 family protein [Dermatophilaceae bacterium]